MATKKFGSAYVQEDYVEMETSLEQFNSYEQGEMGNAEKMKSLNERFLHIIKQEEIKKLQIIESMLQDERELFKTTISTIKMEYKSKIEKTRITNEEQITVIQEDARLVTKELSMKLKTVNEELEATKQSYEKEIFEKNLKITEQEKRNQFLENKFRLADEQIKQKLKRIEELIDIVEENKIKQQQDENRIEGLEEELEFMMTLKKEENETERSEHTISKYLIKAESELQMLMTKIKQLYDTALKDYVNKQKVFYAKKVDSLIEETSKSYTSMTIDIQEKNKRTTTDLVENSFKQWEEFSQLKKDNAELHEQVIKLKKEKAKQKVEIADLRSHEMVICKEYHEETASMFKLFIDGTEKIIERRFTKDCLLTPEIATYETCILKTEKICGIKKTEIFHDKNLEKTEFKSPSVNEPMRSSSAANGDENAKDMSDDEEEID